MFTLITLDHATSTPEIRKDQPWAFCCAMALNGGFYKVQIVNQQNDVIELETK